MKCKNAKYYRIGCYLEENYVDYEINPLNYMMKKEREKAIRNAFNALPFQLRNLLHNYLINNSGFTKLNDITAFKTSEFMENFEVAISILKESFCATYYSSQPKNYSSMEK